MEPITLILTALSKGAASGLQASASSAVKSAYESLMTLTKKRLAGRKDGGMVLAQHKSAPETWGPALASRLKLAGAEGDSELLAAATVLMRLIGEAGSQTGKYSVDGQNAQGMQVGDHTRQYNTFNAPPALSAGMHLANCGKVTVARNKVKGYPIGINIMDSGDTNVHDNEIS
jgi:hypothetical protein